MASKLRESYLFENEQGPRARYDVYVGDGSTVAIVTVYRTGLGLGIERRIHLRLDSSADVLPVIENHFADHFK